jgi:hypothetical protein
MYQYVFQEGEIKERIRESISVYEEALLLQEEEKEEKKQVVDHSEIFHKLFQLLTQLPQLAPSCSVFLLTEMLRILQLGKER